MPLYDFECPKCGRKHEEITEVTTQFKEKYCTKCKTWVFTERCGVQKASFRIKGFSEANLYGLKGK